ncbi:MAG: hypothetical protein DRJ63_05140 [Thermoprotei archaeon]|nr:MAG: hypothetical protein DRJ63_05140 [Thermoprotei archaeon]
MSKATIIIEDSDTVYIDGKYYGSGKVKAELEPGKHLVEIVYKGKWSAATVELKPGETRTVSLSTLKPLLETTPPVKPLEKWKLKQILLQKAIGTQVYDSEAKYTGTVVDIGLIPGSTEFTLIIQTPTRTILEISLEKIDKAKDIIVLKEKRETLYYRKCPICGVQLTWIPEYRRWYCYNCRKYI